MVGGHRLRGFVGRTKAFALRMLQPDRALVRDVVQQSVQLRKAGDLHGALAVYDGLPDPLQQHAEAREGRERAAHLLVKQAHKQAQRLRYDGRLAEALDAYAALPAALHGRPDVVDERASIHEQMRKLADKAQRKREAARKQAAKEIGRLRHAGDLAGALAYIDTLPAEVRELDVVRQARTEVIEALAAEADQKVRQMERTGDLIGMLAVYDALPRELRVSKKTAQKRAAVVERLANQAQEQALRLETAGDLAGALAVYDALPRELRKSKEIGQGRAAAVERLIRHAHAEAGRRREAEDFAGALAVYDALPMELRESKKIRHGRAGVLEKLASRALKESRRLRRAEDFAGALAVCERLPSELRGRADVLDESARSLHALGRLSDALDRFRKALSLDPTLPEAWQHVGTILKDLGRGNEVEQLVRELLSTLPPTFETLVQAARIARSAKLVQVTDDLLGQALSMKPAADGAAVVNAARSLLKQGEQGWVINLLEHVSYPSDMKLQQQVRELHELALAQLRRAGWSDACGPVERTERADVIAVRSILAQADRLGPVGPTRHGIAIVIGSLGAGGAQRQVVELVRQICELPRELVGPVFLLLLSRSSRGPEFHEAKLAGLDVTIEFMSDFQLGAQQVVAPEIAAQLSVLSPNNLDTTVYLVDRLRAHRPAAVLSMSDLLGIPAALAAAIVGVPRVVVSARNQPPPLRRQTESLLKPSYQAALALEWISLVTNCAGTAKQFADWLEVPSPRVGVVYNGVDIDGLIAQREAALVASHRRALGIPASTRIVGSIFQARRQKRPRLWFLAAAAIARRAPDVAFVVIGDKLQGDDISAVLAEHGLQDRFHRPGLQSDVANWLELMDVVMLTSETEGTPNVLLEAQALGRPVVATDVGGCAESFLPDETGVLMSANPPPEEVADAVLRILDDPGFSARAAEHGPAFIRRRFNPQRMASEYVDLCLSPRPASVRVAALG